MKKAKEILSITFHLAFGVLAITLYTAFLTFIALLPFALITAVIVFTAKLVFGAF